MNNTTKSIALLLATVIVGLSVVKAETARPRKRTAPQEPGLTAQGLRTVITKRGVPLTSQLLPGDQLVIVKRGEVPPTEDGVFLEPVASIDEEIAGLKERGHTIAIVEVIRTEGILVEGDSWINTRVTILNDTTVVAGREPIFNAQNSASFDQDGGDVTIDGITLRVDSNNYLFQPHEKYLLTLQRMYDGSAALASVPFRVEDSGHLAPMRVTAGGVVSHPSNFYGMSIDAVIQRFRRSQ